LRGDSADFLELVELGTSFSSRSRDADHAPSSALALDLELMMRRSSSSISRLRLGFHRSRRRLVDQVDRLSAEASVM